MNKKLFRLAKIFTVTFCVSMCCWCAAVEFQSWAKTNGANAVLFAAGIGVKEKDASAASPAPKKKEATEEKELGLPEDGIVPFHADELPGILTTPDPKRESAPVEEIVLDGGEQVANFFVKDTSGSNLNLAEELNIDPAIDIKADGKIEVLIYHTHTSEAYMPSYTGFYYKDMDTRTQNSDESVVAVGEEIRKALEAEGIGAVHDTTVNDTLFNGSYSRSWEVLQNNLEKYLGIQVTIDVHRDSMTTKAGVKYKPTAEINGRKAAQIMLLAGCNASGDWDDFPNWQDNLHLALRVQQEMTELYPQLMRPMDFSDSKYNMNATKGSILAEVGTEVNTVAEAKYSGKMLGEILASVLKKH